MRGIQSGSIHPLINRTFLATVLTLFVGAGVCAQSTEPTASPEAKPDPVEKPADPGSDLIAIQKRIERARGLAAAHKLQTAAHELELVRKEVRDEALRNVTSVLLMGIYLEEGNYVRAQSLLEDDFNARITGNGAALRTYFAIAGQAVNGTRAHLARYRTFGIRISDGNLPPEAVTDIERLRLLLERMVQQAKEIAGERKTHDVLGLLEDVAGIRLSLARDEEDRSKWEAEHASARQALASVPMQVALLGGVPSLNRSRAADTIAPPKETRSTLVEPAPAPKTETLDRDSALRSTAEEKPASAGNGDGNSTPTLTTGSLNTRATKRIVPHYPPLAKSSGIEGTVRVFVTIDESGKVAAVTSSDGPVVLRRSAEEAAKGWKFHPTMVEGKLVRLAGYIEFSFVR